MNELIKIINNNLKVIVAFIFGILITSTIGVVAYTINAKDVSFTPSNKNWKVTNVKEALDDINSKDLNKRICTLIEGNPLEIGSKYECNPNGDKTTKYNFFILKVDNDTVKLIMERNISDFVGSSKTMNWQSAMNFFRNGPGKNLNWIVNVELPRAQDIADAVGNTGWNLADKDYNGWFCLATRQQDYPNSSPWCGNQSEKNFLYDYTKGCSGWGCNNSLDSNYAYGYWTGDPINKLLDNTARAWGVSHGGDLGTDVVSSSVYYSVRPVITISKSNIK